MEETALGFVDGTCFGGGDGFAEDGNGIREEEGPVGTAAAEGVGGVVDY